MDANVLALVCRKTLEDSIIELYEVRQKVTRSPRIARVVAGCQAALGEVHHDVRGSSIEARPDILLAFINDVILKVSARVARQIAVEWIEQVHHGRRDCCLMQRLAGHL